MKKILLFLLLITFYQRGVFSQNLLIEKDKVWKFMSKADNPNAPRNDYALKTGADTLIDGEMYYSILKSTDMLSWQTTENYLRQDDTLVYCYNSSTQTKKTLYNFGLKENDSILIESLDINTYIYVDSIRHNSENVRYFYLSDRYNVSNPTAESHTIIWVENGGCLNGLLDISGGIGKIGGIVELICCKVGSSVIYQNANYDGCYLVSIAKVDTDKHTRMSQNYPNPFKKITTVDVFKNNDEQVYLNIYSVEGKLVNKIQINENGASKVEIRNIGKGVFFYNMSVNGTFLENSKKMICIE